MKKFLFKFVIGTLAATVVSASAVSAAGRYKPGLHLGGTRAKFERGSQRYDYLSNLFFGLRASREVTRYFDYQFELDFVRKGAVTDVFSLVDKSELTTVEGKLSLDYLELPMMVKFSPRLTARVNPALLAGLYVAWNVSHSVSYEDHVAEPIEEFDIATSDYGVAVGVAIDFAIKKRTLSFEFRFTRGLKEIYDRPSGDSLVNRVLTFMVAFTP
ncbi:MAG: PorT family protein [Candidatus Zixiibacteriota bacterium]|nr:MAG: PorT family protein [candidate division Zixibacteria bacterium]